jgi:hypothetical protein
MNYIKCAKKFAELAKLGFTNELSEQEAIMQQNKYYNQLKQLGFTGIKVKFDSNLNPTIILTKLNGFIKIIK